MITQCLKISMTAIKILPHPLPLGWVKYLNFVITQLLIFFTEISHADIGTLDMKHQTAFKFKTLTAKRDCSRNLPFTAERNYSRNLKARLIAVHLNRYEGRKSLFQNVEGT